MNIQNKSFFKVVTVTAVLSGAVALWTGCNKSSSSDGGGSSGLTITGKLSTGTVSSSSITKHAVYVNKKGEAVKQTMGKLDVSVKSTDVQQLDISQYKVRCVTLSGTLQSGEGTCDTAGSFALSLLADAGSPIGCFVMKDTSIVATVAFEGSSTGMSGSSQREGSYIAGSASGGFDFGSVTIDVDKGLAIVKKDEIKASNGASGGSATGTFANMTGDWTIRAIANPPSGYETAGSGNNGPTDGMVIYMSQYEATDASAVKHYGLSIWESSSAYNTCTSGAGEGAQLPAGWTGPSALTSYPNVTTSFPSPTSTTIQNASHGQPLCGVTIQSSTDTCDAFGSGSYTWADNSTHWGMTPAQCKFYCVMNNMWDYSTGCAGDFFVDWGSLWGTNGTTNPFSGITWDGSSWQGLTASTSGDTVSYLNGAVKFKKSPRKRFMFNELVISGAIGTLMDHKDWTAIACTSYESGGGCQSANQVQCHLSENNRLTITQTSATTANVELVQVTQVSATDPAICTTDSNVQRDVRNTKYLFTVTK